MASDDTVYVAVGEVEESELTLLWALENLSPRKVCILHVHQPSKVISSMYENFAEIMFDQRQIRGLEEVGKDMMNRIMDEYLLVCSQAGVNAIRLSMQRDDVAEGIVELIHRHNIKKLVMGAAADKHFTEGMWLMSEKAQYVNENAPPSCQIWFICRQHLVHKSFETGQSSNALSPSGSSMTSSSEAAGILESTVFEEREDSESELEPYVMLHSEEEGSSNDQIFIQLEQALQEAESSNRKAFEESDRRLKAELNAAQAMRQVKAFERLYNKCKREKEAALAKHEEDIETMKRLRDEEHSLAREQQSILESQVAYLDYRTKQLEDKLSSTMEQLLISLKERDELRVQLKNTHKVTEELLRKRAEETETLSTHMQQFNFHSLSVSEIHDATLDQLQICQKEKDELQLELKNTRSITEELLRKQAEDISRTHLQQPFMVFTVQEIMEATKAYDPSFKIAEGARSVYYKCLLRHTEVAIKVLSQNGLQDLSEFQQEVDDLRKPRHPNLVTLIGACPEIQALVYEYVPNGSLEDRLNCRNDTPPLSWQSRIRIATQLCSTLTFLHSDKLVHGNLKPGNILLDDSFGCKLSDFGAYRALSLLENSSNANPYLDPDFCNSRTLSHNLDLYPFGIILLQLLSGRSTQGIAESAHNELQNGGNLSSFLDSSAGNWPDQDERLTRLAIRCCDVNRQRRPDLPTDVLNVLEMMRSAASISYVADSNQDNCEPPPYFICPILQEVMSDPHVAADGYTYEATALQGWLANHDTSPMTNLRLRNLDLVPNFPLRSAIQQWQENR